MSSANRDILTVSLPICREEFLLEGKKVCQPQSDSPCLLPGRMQVFVIIHGKGNFRGEKLSAG
jgi:hypothetical protein